MLKDFSDGIIYNLKGFALGVKRPKLLLLGLLRFIVILVITIVSASLVLTYHESIMSMFWTRPESIWILWLWQALSWFLSLLLVGVSVLFSYIVAQILFCVFIMDLMSRITEKILTGKVVEPQPKTSLISHFVYLIKQEIPRTILPLLFTMAIMVFGWVTPLGPLFAILSSGIAAVFLAWDNTDILPARRFEPFKKRFDFFRRKLVFHLGFGL